METTVILAIVIGGISIVVTALGFMVDGSSTNSPVTWLKSTFFGAILSNVIAGIQSIVLVLLTVGAKTLTKTTTALVSGVSNILNKNNCSSDSSISDEHTGPNIVETTNKTSKKIDSGSCESLLDEIKKFSDASNSAEEKESARRMLEVLKILEEIDASLEKKER